MTTKALFSVLVLFGVVLAGCLGGGEPSDVDTPPDPSGPAGFDDETGGIEGFVVDEESQPVADAQVGILQLDLETATDENGRFAFDNVPPGKQAVVVQKLGYESVSRVVDVVAGQSSEIQLAITAIVVHTPYYESIPKEGLFECTWRHVLGSGPCGYLGGLNSTTGNPLQEHVFTNSKRKWNYDAAAGALTVINEAVWTQNTAATGDNLRIFFSYANRTASHTFCQTDGFSPLTLEWEREEVDEEGECLTGGSGGLSEMDTIPEEGLKVQTFVSVGATQTPVGGVNAAIALDQRFEIWFSLFYWEQAPEGFSALPDA